MEKLVPSLVGAFWMSALGHLTQAQTTPAGGVGIGTATPDASALLDLTSGSKGPLAPRLTQTQRGAIASPATGLLVYQPDGPQPGFWYYAATGWTFLNPTRGGTGDNLGNHTATQNLNLAAHQLVSNGGSQGLALSNSGQVGMAPPPPPRPWT